MNAFDHEGGQAAASRMIERKLAEAVGVEPERAVAPLAELLGDIRRQLQAIETKMAAGFKLAAQRIDAIEERLDGIETRLTKIEQFNHVPPDLVAALKNGSQS
jgi:hypothetical protein